jgi:hypothetical protein
LTPIRLQSDRAASSLSGGFSWARAEAEGRVQGEGRPTKRAQSRLVITKPRDHFAALYGVGKGHVEMAHALAKADPPAAEAVGQRAMVARKLATMREGRPKTGSNDLVSQADAADLLNVGVATVKRAAAARRVGVPELVEASPPPAATP